MKRSSGVLLPLSALPGKYGIGGLGKCAYDFIDFLDSAGQAYWQMLPIGHTDMGNSPYSSISTFAGNPNYIDIDALLLEGLLEEETFRGLCFGAQEDRVDYGLVSSSHETLLRKAYENSCGAYNSRVEAFSGENPWLRGYALYMALKRRFNETAWYEWPEEIKRRRQDSVDFWERELENEIGYWKFTQYLFHTQWQKLRSYALERGIKLIGDIPIYVAGDSADVWLEPWFFELDGQCRPKNVAGVPPDYFSETGQLWGNPLYDWDKMRADGWGFWIRRVDGAAKLFDVVRIDHFRAFSTYWSVPADAETACKGRWRQGPGMELVGMLQNWFAGTEFIAEDLGILTPDVRELLAESGLPGMKILEFAFTPGANSDYLPHNFERNCVAYAGTHDNNTILGWLEEASGEERDFAAKYIGAGEKESFVWAMLRCGMESVANLFVCQMQDILEKPGNCRTNTPGLARGNWQWRLREGECSPQLAKKLAEYTKMTGRYNYYK